MLQSHLNYAYVHTPIHMQYVFLIIMLFLLRCLCQSLFYHMHTLLSHAYTFYHMCCSFITCLHLLSHVNSLLYLYINSAIHRLAPQSSFNSQTIRLN